MQRLSVEEFIKDSDGGCVIDVRSPAEYKKGHIPGSINIPIFTNQERAEVGTVYKQQSREEAILLGLDIVGPKLRNIAKKGKEKAINNTLYVYCWRGGMRSEKMAWLFDLNGIDTRVLEGGYKNYRSYGAKRIDQFTEFILIQGPTGSGKTEILQELGKAGEQIINLEELANHKGSAFGGLGQQDQPTTQHFQNEIYALLDKFDPNKPVWLESESSTIGRVYLPERLWQRMNDATVISILLPIESRVQNIISQYGQFSKEELCSKVEQLKQNLGTEAVTEISTDIQNDDLKAAVTTLLTYYDKTYAFSAAHHKSRKPITVTLENVDPQKNAKLILESLNHIVN